MLKRFYKTCFESRKVESMSLGKGREFGVTVLAGTERVFQKMLSNSKIICNKLRGVVCLAGTRKIRVIFGKRIVPDWERIAQCTLAIFGMYDYTSYVPTITLAHKLIDDIVVVMGR